MNITFTQLCVRIIMVAVVGIVTFIGWMISTIGLGVCLTTILYLTGLI
jgi:hypothetical protein